MSNQEVMMDDRKVKTQRMMYTGIAVNADRDALKSASGKGTHGRCIAVQSDRSALIPDNNRCTTLHDAPGS